MNKLDKQYNYIVINKSGNATSVILNRYKTNKKYGRFIIDLTQPDKKPIFLFSEIRKAIKNFMKHKNIRVLKTLDENNLGSIARVLLSSFVIIFIFY